MEWRKYYLDVILVPLGFTMSMAYHAWLWHMVRTRPLSTIIGTNAAARRVWVFSMVKDDEKKNILAVQTLRNTIMGSTLMATTSILLCTGLAAVVSSTYSVKKPVNDAVYGAHGEFMVALKYVTLLTIFLFSFICHSLSIRFINQVNILINSPDSDSDSSRADSAGGNPATPDYVAELLERGFMLNTIGNRLFYAALPLLLWIFGPVLAFLCSAALVPVLYNLDILERGGGRGLKKANGQGNGICADCAASLVIEVQFFWCLFTPLIIIGFKSYCGSEHDIQSTIDFAFFKSSSMTALMPS